MRTECTISHSNPQETQEPETEIKLVTIDLFRRYPLWTHFLLYPSMGPGISRQLRSCAQFLPTIHSLLDHTHQQLVRGRRPLQHHPQSHDVSQPPPRLQQLGLMIYQAALPPLASRTNTTLTLISSQATPERTPTRIGIHWHVQ